MISVLNSDSFHTSNEEDVKEISNIQKWAYIKGPK